MPPKKEKPKNISEYIQAAPKEAQEKLREMRRLPGMSSAGLISLVAAWLALTALAMACGGASDGAGPTLVVNSTLDTDERDGVLTLREALLLATGQLGEDELNEAERRQLDGSPGPERADTIIFDEATFTDEEPKTIALDSGLPPMDGGGDAIDGANAVIIEGQDPDVICLSLRSDANEAQGTAAPQLPDCGAGLGGSSGQRYRQTR